MEQKLFPYCKFTTVFVNNEKKLLFDMIKIKECGLSPIFLLSLPYFFCFAAITTINKNKPASADYPAIIMHLHSISLSAYAPHPYGGRSLPSPNALSCDGTG